MESLRVSLIQSDLTWEDPAANLAMFEEKIRSLKGQTDLVLLPEMFPTGFTMQAEKLAEPADGPVVRWMADRAGETGAVVCGSFIARENDRYFNRLIWMQPDGTFSTYDKRHLFTLAGEQNYYSAGKKRLVVDWKGWKIMPLICYDLRFPVWSRNVEDYDLLIYVANWPQARSYAWKSLLVARAIENQAYTTGLNRVGTDGAAHYYSGDSAMIDYAGNLLVQVSHIETIFTATLSFEAQQQFRKKFSFLPDRDVFQIL